MMHELKIYHKGPYDEDPISELSASDIDITYTLQYNKKSDNLISI